LAYGEDLEPEDIDERTAITWEAGTGRDERTNERTNDHQSPWPWPCGGLKLLPTRNNPGEKRRRAGEKAERGQKGGAFVRLPALLVDRLASSLARRDWPCRRSLCSEFRSLGPASP
jgi:hypothetical protein